MKKFKGIGLLLLSNLLIVITLSITIPIIINFVLPLFGIDLRGSFNQGYLILAGLFGFGGAFISLAISKFLAKRMINGVQLTAPQTSREQLIYETVQKISQRLNITMPEVWVYSSPDPNAFATGPSKNNSMIAVSTGLLDNLNENEVRAVIAHEMGHVYNGDMFTTTVLSGLMNTFVYFIAFWVVRQLGERNPFLAHMAWYFIVGILSVLAMIPINWFSRRREFEADRFAGNTVGKEYMISALQAIDRWVKGTQFQYGTEDALATMKISGQSSSFMMLFSTHPPIESRVEALKQG